MTILEYALLVCVRWRKKTPKSIRDGSRPNSLTP